jgi:hypothetical protein
MTELGEPLADIKLVSIISDSTRTWPNIPVVSAVLDTADTAETASSGVYLHYHKPKMSAIHRIPAEVSDVVRVHSMQRLLTNFVGLPNDCCPSV